MSSFAAEIAQQIDRLEHPDAGVQDAVLAKLSADVEHALPVVLANFALVSARVRRALLRWLVEHMTKEASLPLMRYIFDERENVAEDMGRVMAMALLFRRAQGTDDPAERGRLRAFSEDMCADSNPEVRALAASTLAYIGDARSMERLEPLRVDYDEEVREAAYQSFKVLEGTIPAGGADVQSAQELYEKLRTSLGPRRRHWIRHWRRHPDRASIALSSLRARDDLRPQALEILLARPRAEARPFLAPMIIDDPASDEAILALRLLSALADPGEGRPDEVRAIRRALRSTSVLSRAAACAAIEQLRLPVFLDELAEALLSPDLELAAAAAQAVAALVTVEHQNLVRPICQAVQLHERRRREELGQAERLTVVTNLFLAMGAIITTRSLLSSEVHRLALTTLQRSGHHRPIRLAALDLLLKIVPVEGLDESERWDQAPCRLLLSSFDPADRRGAEMLAKLLLRVAPNGMPGLAEVADELWTRGAADPVSIVIPLLERADTNKARQTLQKLSDGDDAQAAQAASDALRRYRNKIPVIDVDFIPRKK